MLGRYHRLLQQLGALAEQAMPGNLVEVMMRCGTRSCGCHQDPARRHGPHLYIKFRDAEGRSRSIYVPRSHESEAREGVEAWAKMRQILQEISEHNRETFKQRLRSRRRD